MDRKVLGRIMTFTFVVSKNDIQSVAEAMFRLTCPEMDESVVV